MARQNPIFSALNRGEVSPQLLGRTDLEHLRMAGQFQENWQPRVLGPMTIRPGSEYIGTINDATTPCTIIPFIASSDDTAIIELTPNQMRVWIVDEDLAISLVERAAVSATVPAFNSGAWFISARTGNSTPVINPSFLQFFNTNVGAYSAISCGVTIPSGDVGIEHAIRLVVADGPVTFKIGSAVGADDIFAVETLDSGTYSLAFTPTFAGQIIVTVGSAIAPENFNTTTQSQPQGIQSTSIALCAMESAGPLALPTPWGASVLTDLLNDQPSTVRFSSSADVIFVAAPGSAQMQINRYSPTSWSLVNYRPVKGPMNAVTGSNSVILSVSGISGNPNLTANQPFFTPDDVGTLFRLFHNSQNFSQVVSFNGAWTDPIRVTGVSSISEVSGGTLVDVSVPDRQFSYTVAGSWSGTVSLQRSYDGPNTGYTTYQTLTHNGTQPVDDNLNNEIIYYRLGFSNGNLSSGQATLTFNYVGGGGYGVCRVLTYIDSQTVNVEVLVPFSSNGAAQDWHQSEWSALKGFPTSTDIHEGRLWWAGADRWWGSTSDDYSNFDFDAIGDAAYIDIQVGRGPIANINWLLSLDGLLGGGDTQIIAARSDAIQSPLTPTNFNLRFTTSQGSAPMQAFAIDNRAIFVNQSRRKIFQAIYDLYTYNYKAVELSNLNPDIGAPKSAANAHSGGYMSMAIQRNPDTIIHLIRSDGQIVCLLNDVDDDVKAFWRKTTAGSYDNVLVLPGVVEDQVIVTVQRNGKRFLERFARLDECTGDLICKLADSFGTYTGPPTYTFSAPWLANQTVEVWIDGTDVTLTKDESGNPVSPIKLDVNGNGVLPTAAQNITFGLPYTARFFSTKLAYAAQMGTAVNEIKRADHLGLVLQNTHCQGIRYGAPILNPQYGEGSFGPDFGPDFDVANNPFWDSGVPIDSLPMVEKGVVLPVDWIWTYYDAPRFEFANDSSTDSRLYIEAASPRPATVLAVTFSIETND